MTERFSPEYKTFILSDEAKVLQERCRFSYGDWYTYGSHQRIYLVDDHELYQMHKHPEAVEKHGLVWFPTLTDSLDMIEEAGWKVGFDNTEAGYSFCAYKAGKPFQRLMLFSQESDIDHAAAKLAVRVLEGKGIEKFDWEQDVQRELMDA